jgi:hypothetical protein
MARPRDVNELCAESNSRVKAAYGGSTVSGVGSLLNAALLLWLILVTIAYVRINAGLLKTNQETLRHLQEELRDNRAEKAGPMPRYPPGSSGSPDLALVRLTVVGLLPRLHRTYCPLDSCGWNLRRDVTNSPEFSLRTRSAAGFANDEIAIRRSSLQQSIQFIQARYDIPPLVTRVRVSGGSAQS